MGKQKTINDKLKTNSIYYDKINIMFFIVYAILITLPLLFRGGYFEDEMIPILIGFNLVFIAYLFIQSKNKEFRLIRTPVEVLFLAIGIMYLVSIFYGVSKKGSLIEFGKYFSYFGFIVMALNLAENKKLGEYIIDSIILGSIILSIIGIGTMAGTWEYNGAIVGNRLSSTFQYPNTLAAYASGIYILSITLLSNSDNKYKKILYGIGAGSCLFTLILTYSRAMWLMFPLFIVIYFILVPSSRKLEVLLYVIITCLTSIPAAFITTKVSEASLKIWLIYVAAIGGSGLIVYIASLLEKKYREFSVKKLFIILTIVIILVGALGVYVISSTTEVVLSNEAAEDKWSVLNRNITKTNPNTEYNLNVLYSGENKSEAPYLGRIIIYNLDENGGATQLHLENIVSTEENNINITFITPEDSIGIKVRFDNYYKDTNFTIVKGTIAEAKDNNQIINIPLKYKYIPESIVSRFNSITAGESSLTTRIRFNLDGLNIVKDNLLLGTGAEGWRTLYERYQSQPYTSNLAHNYFLQLWIETGLIGIMSLAALLLILTIALFKTYKNLEDTNRKLVIVGLYSTILTMLAHAFVDFDMSLSGYAIVVWVCLGVLLSQLDFSNTKLEEFTKRISVKAKVVNYGIILSSMLLTFSFSSIILGQVYAQKAIEANESNSIGAVASNFENAVKLDKLEPTYKIDLANTYLSLYNATENQEYLRNAFNQVEEYVNLAPESIETNVNASSFYLSTGQVEKGLELLEKSVAIQPLRVNSYINKLDGYFAVFDYYFFKGEDNLAIESLREGLRVKDQIAEANTRSTKPVSEDIDLVYKYGESKFFLENFDILADVESRNLRLDFAYYFEDINSDEKIDMLNISKPADSNIVYEKVVEKDQQYLRVFNNGTNYGFIYPYGIKLEPNTNYVVDIKAKGTANPGTFKSYIVSSGAADPIQGGMEDIVLTNEWEKYTFEFTTDSDINSGKQYIRLQHNGNDDGYIDIEEVVIYKVEE